MQVLRSIIKGKIQNYDEEVGIFVNVDFGAITLPVQTIKEISDPVKKKYYNGLPVIFGFSGGYYIPYAGLAPDFESDFSFSAFAEFDSDFVRGLYIGGEFSAINIDYKVDDSEFSIYTFQPYAIYKFLQMRKKSSLINRFIPFVSAGMGGAYIIRKSPLNTKTETELDTVLNIKTGFDINITERLGTRFYTGTETILQNSSKFNRVFFNAGIIYSF